MLEPTVLSGAVLFRAMVPLVPQSLPNLDGKPVLISSGRQDPLVPPDNSQRLAELLRQAGADVTLSWQNTGHGLTETELAAAKAWLSEKVP